MREEKEKGGGEFQAGGVGIVMKSGCVKNNINKREDKDVLSHGGESGDSHADPFRWINLIYFPKRNENASNLSVKSSEVVKAKFTVQLQRSCSPRKKGTSRRNLGILSSPLSFFPGVNG